MCPMEDEPLARRLLTRRSFLAGTLAAVAAACTNGDEDAGDDTTSTPSDADPDDQLGTAELPGRVFSLGVASGDPLPDRVIIWTRLLPGADEVMPAEDFPV